MIERKRERKDNFGLFTCKLCDKDYTKVNVNARTVKDMCDSCKRVESARIYHINRQNTVNKV